MRRTANARGRVQTLYNTRAASRELQVQSVSSKNSYTNTGELTVRKLSNKVRLFPILFFFIYLNFTVLLFASGPWPYPVHDGTKLYVFLTFAHLALLLGYLSAAFGEPAGYSGRWSVSRLLVISTVVNLLLFFPTSLFLTGSSIPDIRGALADLGSAYRDSILLRQENIPVIMYLRMSLAPLLVITLPLVIYYWNNLKPSIRNWAVAAALTEVAIYVAMGRNAGIARFFLISLGLYSARHLVQGRSPHWFQNRIRLLMFGVVASYVIFSFFSATIVGREASLTAFHFPHLGINADRDHVLLRYLPSEMSAGTAGLISYFTHGYYALYLSLDEPFEPMFGAGNSIFLIRQAARITGNQEILYLSYPLRIEKYGWDGYQLWSTIYPWIASDASFPGTILIVFLIGRLFALSWLDTVKGENPFAVVMFSQFVIMLLYFSANNQLLQSGEGFIAFWTIMFFWLRSRVNACKAGASHTGNSVK
jgi:hypothetical protein